MGSSSWALLVLGVFLVQSTADIPGCNYFDTVKLTQEQQLENGSYRYRNVIIPKEKTGIYDYRISLDGKMQMASNYTRGCVCHVKSCIPFCCDPHEFLVDALLNVTLFNGTETEINLRKDFLVQPVYEEFCDFIGLNSSLDHQWTLFENGILFKHTNNHNKNKGRYCLVPLAVNDDVYKLGAHYLAESSSTKSTITLPDALRVISIFCMIITIATYLYFPKFRSVYDKCCICYFFCLAVSFTLLWCELFFIFISGYIGYYTVMATFLWLLMINFTLWKKFKNLGIAFKLFFRLFAITGVSWLLEIIAFLCSINNFGVTQLIDIITSAQGILLFFVSVLKKEVIKAFNERVEKRKSGNSNDYINATDS
ncbi:uncharacterized protein Dvir_GJ16328 [Drosophila virilis]|uniref:Methuselah N-terminal domain-containing protein n=1 Tax=Drosophila virilis TaxID=7244 RepID=B4MH16_DROVI|nr:uncharacterized protein Dvir_GJ16328 [Drosophila virilis]